MADSLYVGLYEEAGREVADAIDQLVRSSRGAVVASGSPGRPDTGADLRVSR
jgi:hypothetical protein